MVLLKLASSTKHNNCCFGRYVVYVRALVRVQSLLVALVYLCAQMVYVHVLDVHVLGEVTSPHILQHFEAMKNERSRQQALGIVATGPEYKDIDFDKIACEVDGLQGGRGAIAHSVKVCVFARAFGTERCMSTFFSAAFSSEHSIASTHQLTKHTHT